jgi:tRNA A22 N-methylase
LPDYEQKDIRVICADATKLPSEKVSGTVVLAGMGARAILRILNHFVFPNCAENTQLLLIPNAEPLVIENAFAERQMEFQKESIQDGTRSFSLYRAMHTH